MIPIIIEEQLFQYKNSTSAFDDYLRAKADDKLKLGIDPVDDHGPRIFKELEYDDNIIAGEFNY